MTKLRTILVFGSLAGLILEVTFLGLLSLGAHGGDYGAAVGFLTMFVALSLIFVGMKRYRDVEMGGVIRFMPAFMLGLGMALIAAVFYVVGWEIYLAVTGNTFIADYFAGQIESARAAGASAAEIAALEASAVEFGEKYANPLYRIPITFTEIAPVALIVPLVSAALLRNPRFMPSVAPA